MMMKIPTFIVASILAPLCVMNTEVAALGLNPEAAKISFDKADKAVESAGKIEVTTEEQKKLKERITKGALELILKDPDPATFISGSFVVTYPTKFLSVYDYGWLGPWGLDPSEIRPNPGEAFFGLLDLQEPSSDLTTSVVNDFASGQLVVDFGWDNGGIVEEEPFFFFATLFETLKNGKLSVVESQDDANFFVSTEGISCAINNILQSCSSDETTFYRVSQVPIPAGILLLPFSIAAFAVARKKKS